MTASSSASSRLKAPLSRDQLKERVSHSTTVRLSIWILGCVLFAAALFCMIWWTASVAIERERPLEEQEMQQEWINFEIAWGVLFVACIVVFGLGSYFRIRVNHACQIYKADAATDEQKYPGWGLWVGIIVLTVIGLAFYIGSVSWAQSSFDAYRDEPFLPASPFTIPVDVGPFATGIVGWTFLLVASCAAIVSYNNAGSSIAECLDGQPHSMQTALLSFL